MMQITRIEDYYPKIKTEVEGLFSSRRRCIYYKELYCHGQQSRAEMCRNCFMCMSVNKTAQDLFDQIVKMADALMEQEEIIPERFLLD